MNRLFPLFVVSHLSWMACAPVAVIPTPREHPVPIDPGALEVHRITSRSGDVSFKYMMFGFRNDEVWRIERSLERVANSIGSFFLFRDEVSFLAESSTQSSHVDRELFVEALHSTRGAGAFVVRPVQLVDVCVDVNVRDRELLVDVDVFDRYANTRLVDMSLSWALVYMYAFDRELERGRAYAQAKARASEIADSRFVQMGCVQRWENGSIADFNSCEGWSVDTLELCVRRDRGEPDSDHASSESRAIPRWIRPTS